MPLIKRNITKSQLIKTELKRKIISHTLAARSQATETTIDVENRRTKAGARTSGIHLTS